MAFVQLLPDATTAAEEPMACAARQLTFYTRPGEIVLFSSLPSASTEKILKYALGEARVCREGARRFAWLFFLPGEES